MIEWDDKYAGYVIFSRVDNAFVGPNSEMWRVALRTMTVRFTKANALGWIQEQEKPDDYVIEDAT